MRKTFAAICLATLVAACAAPESRSNPAVPVFIISIDTLRADRLPVYGYAAGSTPNIDALRRDSILYRWAFSNCPQTLPSHASLFTGTLPPVHGVRDNIGYRLDPGMPTIASRLREQGYATGAAVSSYVMRAATGIGTGFQFYDDGVGGTRSRLTSAERDGEETRQALTSWIEETPVERMFAFLHLYEPHAPYAAPRDFRRVEDDYDNEVAYADDVVGRFLETLRSRGLYDDALIILLSDHGEGLGDHGEDEHGLFVYRESIHVPLLIKLPGRQRAGETVNRPVSLHDVAEVVTGVAADPAAQPSLLSTSPTAQPVYSETYFPRLHFGWSELRAVISGDRHLIDAPARELYDYVRDPAELRNLADSQRRDVHALTAIARRIDSAFKPPSQTDPEDRRKLAALGYIGSGGSKQSRRADPKDKVQIVRDLRRAFLFSEQGRHRDAIPLLERVVFAEPDIVDGWAMLGRSRAATGQRALALEAYREGLKRFPTNADLALLAADEYASAGRWDSAVEYAERVVPDDPVLGHEALARIEARRGDAAAAKEHAEAAIRHAPRRVPTLMLLADLARRAARPADQLMWLDRAEREIAARDIEPVEGLSFQRGEALLALGRASEAEAAYRKEVTQFPRHAEAWSSLAVVLAAQGRREEMRAVLGEALRVNDTTAMRSLAREALEVAGDREGLRLLNRGRG